MMQGLMDPDPNAAFVREMIPHHQGTIDMARIVIKYEQDPEIRKLAQKRYSTNTFLQNLQL